MHKMQLARLTSDDRTAVHNMRLLEPASESKKSSIVPFSLKFDVHKVMDISLNIIVVSEIPCILFFQFLWLQKKHAARKDRPGEEVQWQLSRFYPIIEVHNNFGDFL